MICRTAPCIPAAPSLELDVHRGKSMSMFIHQAATCAAGIGCGLGAATIITFAFGAVSGGESAALLKRWLG